MEMKLLCNTSHSTQICPLCGVVLSTGRASVRCCECSHVGCDSASFQYSTTVVLAILPISFQVQCSHERVVER